MNKTNVAAILLATLCLAGCGVNSSPGSGDKIGQIVKINKQGMLFNTWEAELIRGGMNNGSGSFGTAPFNFTIEDNKTAERCRQYMQDQTEVIITYRMEGIYKLTRSDSSGHFLVSIRSASTNSNNAESK